MADTLASLRAERRKLKRTLGEVERDAKRFAMLLNDLAVALAVPPGDDVVEHARAIGPQLAELRDLREALSVPENGTPLVDEVRALHDALRAARAEAAMLQRRVNLHVEGRLLLEGANEELTAELRREGAKRENVAAVLGVGLGQTVLDCATERMGELTGARERIRQLEEAQRFLQKRPVPWVPWWWPW